MYNQTMTISYGIYSISCHFELEPSFQKCLLTHWPLREVKVILPLYFSNSFYELVFSPSYEIGLMWVPQLLTASPDFGTVLAWSWHVHGVVKLSGTVHGASGGYRADSRLAPNQWETSLHSNTVSYWLDYNRISPDDMDEPVWMF